jgi:hypothetical protein
MHFFERKLNTGNCLFYSPVNNIDNLIIAPFFLGFNSFLHQFFCFNYAASSQCTRRLCLSKLLHGPIAHLGQAAYNESAGVLTGYKKNAGRWALRFIL